MARRNTPPKGLLYHIYRTHFVVCPAHKKMPPVRGKNSRVAHEELGSPLGTAEPTGKRRDPATPETEGPGRDGGDSRVDQAHLASSTNFRSMLILLRTRTLR